MLHFAENKADTAVTKVISLTQKFFFHSSKQGKMILGSLAEQDREVQPKLSCQIKTLCFIWSWAVRLEQPQEQVL